jgi:hypothetical protein
MSDNLEIFKNRIVYSEHNIIQQPVKETRLNSTGNDLFCMFILLPLSFVPQIKLMRYTSSI